MTYDEELWQAQLASFPESRRVEFDEVWSRWTIDRTGCERQHIFRLIALTKQWKEGFFYEVCADHEAAGSVWRGYRYGTEPHEYLSGFTEL